MKKTLQTFCFALVAAFGGLAGADQLIGLSETHSGRSATPPAESFVDCIRNKEHDEWEMECSKKAKTEEEKDLLNSLKSLTAESITFTDILIIKAPHN